MEGLPFRPIHRIAEGSGVTESGNIDQTISADAIECIPDIYKAAQQMDRVLGAEGGPVVNAPNSAFSAEDCLHFTTEKRIGEDLTFDWGHLHYFKFWSLRLVLKSVGLHIESESGYGPLGKIHNVLAQMLNGGVQIVARKLISTHFDRPRRCQDV